MPTTGPSPRGGFRDPDRARRAAPNLVSQGITTVVVNQDGRSPWPSRPARAAREEGHRPQRDADGRARHGAAARDGRRRAAAGAPQTRSTRMRELVRQGAARGRGRPVGGPRVRAGPLEHDRRGRGARARDAAVRRRLHLARAQRGQRPDVVLAEPGRPGPPTLLDAVRETIEIGEQTGARVVASHLKAKGEHYWGSSAAAIDAHPARPRPRRRRVGRPVSLPDERHRRITVLIPAWATRHRRTGPAPPAPRGSVLKRVLGDPPPAS